MTATPPIDPRGGPDALAALLLVLQILGTLAALGILIAVLCRH